MYKEIRIREKHSLLSEWFRTGAYLSDSVYTVSDSGIVFRLAREKAYQTSYLQNVKTDTLLNVLKSLIKIRKKSQIIYDQDNRREISEETNPERASQSQRVALIVEAINITSFSQSQSKIATKPFKAVGPYPICNTEAYLGQPTGGIGSGVSLSSTLFLTAAHCLKKLNDRQVLDRIRIVFGYWGFRTGDVIVNNSQIYRIKSIVKRIDRDSGDYAVLRLEREVPLTGPDLAYASNISPNDSVYAIGHPLGLPMKITDKAILFQAASSRLVKSNLDAFAGNSGSPVFNQRNELVGILIRGGIDMLVRPGSVCAESKVCTMITSDGPCSGEDILSHSVFKPQIP
ncbi:hypothetical protein GCM10007390_19630 [Persicitalea jodogahamensis]|uniref:Serine protease n=1 Tax=Persicitalea jodogahamensis TaxID=402147 RepID=A0A8J3G8K7_9BACT|nr:hypothetical protein GCM10007390_19630 [Persicitalea jodogahamensis]